MSTSTTNLLQVLAADIEVAAIPAVVSFLNTTAANAKLPVAAQPIAEIAAWTKLQSDLIAAGISEESTVVQQINTIIQTKLAAILATATSTVTAASAASAAAAAPAAAAA